MTLVLLLLLLLPQDSLAYHQRRQTYNRRPRYHMRRPPPPPEYKITNITDIEGEPEWKLLCGIVLPKPSRVAPARWQFICKYECDQYYIGEILCFQTSTKGDTYIMPCDDNLDLSRMMAVFVAALSGCVFFCIIWCLCARRAERIERNKRDKARTIKIKELLIPIKEGREDGTEDSIDCPICLNRIELNDAKTVKTVCEHHYHVGCITPWLLSNNTCPLCKRDLFKVQPAEVQEVQEV